LNPTSQLKTTNYQLPNMCSTQIIIDIKTRFGGATLRGALNSTVSTPEMPLKLAFTACQKLGCLHKPLWLCDSVANFAPKKRTQFKPNFARTAHQNRQFTLVFEVFRSLCLGASVAITPPKKPNEPNFKPHLTHLTSAT
jgi:hypothetical protein